MKESLIDYVNSITPREQPMGRGRIFANGRAMAEDNVRQTRELLNLKIKQVRENMQREDEEVAHIDALIASAGAHSPEAKAAAERRLSDNRRLAVQRKDICRMDIQSFVKTLDKLTIAQLQADTMKKNKKEIQRGSAAERKP